MLKNNQPKLMLTALLRRRRQSLKSLILELGVTTHSALEIWCKKIGVVPPAIEEFVEAFPMAQMVNSPQEGIIVLEAPPVISAETGAPIDVERGPALVFLPEESSADGGEGSPEATQKKPRKKKEANPSDAE